MKLKINSPNTTGKDILENITTAFGRAPRVSLDKSARPHAGYLCSLFISFIAALLVCFMAQTVLAERTMQLQTLLAQAVSKRPPSIFSTASLSPNTKINFSAFKVANKTVVVEQPEEKKETKPIDAFRLIGTVSPVAAWIAVDNKTSLVLKDQEFNGYHLEYVLPGSVTFLLEDEEYELYLNFSANAPAAPKAPAKEPVEAAATTTEPGKSSEVQVADFNGTDGVISRELLNSLLMNPYGELGKVRIVPSQAGGITIRNMRPDSLLHQLGVKQNDQITGINGVPIKDMPSVVNAMNSMMSGSRLDFDVIRDKQPGKLTYVVK